MTVIENARPVARKAHRCDECARPIWGGEQYHRQRGIHTDSGEPYVWKACRQCRAFVHDLWSADFYGEDEWSYAYLPDMDWSDVTRLGEVWLHRIALWKRQWRRRGELVDYPTEAQVRP